jgi:hypothetical protein
MKLSTMGGKGLKRQMEGWGGGRAVCGWGGILTRFLSTRDGGGNFFLVDVNSVRIEQRGASSLGFSRVSRDLVGLGLRDKFSPTVLSSINSCSPVIDLISEPRRSRHRNAPAIPRTQQQTTGLSKSWNHVVLDVSKHIPRHLATTYVGWVGQHGPRDQCGLHTRFGEADRGRGGRYHPTQTNSKLVIEHIHTRAPRNPRVHLSLERHSGWKSPKPWRIAERLLQFPPRLSPLVRSRLSHSGAVDFLG